MIEQHTDYITESDETLQMLGKGYENAAEIHPPKTIRAVKNKGLIEYRVWGWVKISANFIHHIHKLKGAKLAIWQVIALSIDEYGECNLTIQQIADLSGYSYSETHESLKELDEMEYLSISKEKGRKSMYSPSFAARGENKPTDNPSRKTIGTPLQSSGGDPSSPSIKKERTSIKELKELKDIRFAKTQTALEKIGILLTSTDPMRIDVWMEKHTDEHIQKAIDITQAKGVRNLAYVNTILAGWLENGYPEEKKIYKTKKSDQPSPLEKYAASIGAI